jgi:DNA topoisomerase-1
VINLSYTLIITEKPTAAKTVAKALADGEVKEFEKDGSRWYEIKKDGKPVKVAPAAGHLFMLKQKSRGWNYPVFDVEWVPSFNFKASKFSEKFFRNLEMLAKDAGDFIIATDYDDEGEVIGANILRFICKREDAPRMKFSTMTKEELTESYKNMDKHLNKTLAEAGFTRHMMDWYFGINLTRALTNSIKAAGKRFRILSTGRVQGPTLHMLASHEKEIKAFKPDPFWIIEADVKIGKNYMKAEYEKDKVWDKKEADGVFGKSKNCKEASVKDISKKVMTQAPPKPYNTTSMLGDIYRYFGYPPQQGMQIAESLYQAGYISYPRTSSEKLPKDIDYKKILSNIAKIPKYEKLATSLLTKKELVPNEGAKTDAAHPAIYPTTQLPKKLGDKQQKVYDLLVHRFMAVFGEPAKRESQKISLDLNGNTFYVTGKKTVEAGWTALYGRYSARDEIILPEMKVGEKIKVDKVELQAKETQPPARYSQGSVLKEMEDKGLGTKATRPGILQILYNRGYLIGRSIEVTELGMNLSNILEKNVSDIVSEDLTKHFEEECDKVESGKMKKEEVLKEAEKTITDICEKFKAREIKIGKELTESVIASQDKQSILGTCPKCGGTLKVMKMWNTGSRFVGCTGYKKGCRFGSPLPREGTIVSTGNVCQECKTPIIQVYRQGAKPFRMCLSLECPTKKDWLDKSKLKINQKNEEPAVEKAESPKDEKPVKKSKKTEPAPAPVVSEKTQLKEELKEAKEEVKELKKPKTKKSKKQNK